MPANNGQHANQTAEKARVIEATRVWLQMRDDLHAADPDQPGYDDLARDFNEAECALSLAVRLLIRAQKGTKS